MPPRRSKPTARIVKRIDVNGRRYYVHVDTGAQRSRAAWERDIARRHAQEKPARRPSVEPTTRSSHT